MSETLLSVGHGPFGALSLSTLPWMPQLAGAHWVNAPGAETIHWPRSYQLIGWDGPHEEHEALDLREVASGRVKTGVFAHVDAAVGVYRATGARTLKRAALSPSAGVISRVRVADGGVIGMDTGSEPMPLTGLWARLMEGGRSDWLLGAAAAARQSGHPYRDRNTPGMETGEYVAVKRKNGLSPVWLMIDTRA